MWLCFSIEESRSGEHEPSRRCCGFNTQSEVHMHLLRPFYRYLLVSNKDTKIMNVEVYEVICRPIAIII